MKIGVVKEIKVHEYRVALTPAGCEELTASGHEITVDKVIVAVGNKRTSEFYQSKLVEMVSIQVRRL